MVSHKVRLLTISIMLCAMLVLVSQAVAHPMGNFSINRYARLHVGETSLDVTYIVDRAEIPAFQNRAHIDTDGDGVVSAAETAAYVEVAIPALLANIALTSDDVPMALQTADWSLTFPPGQGELLTERLELDLTAALPGTSGRIAFEDNNFADRIGWREIIVVADEGITLQDSTAPTVDISAELTTFPEDTAIRPDDHLATFLFFSSFVGAGADTDNNASFTSSPLASDRFSSDYFAELITVPELTPRIIAFALAAAFVLGAGHALTPGHGKTIVGAYLVGSRGTAKHALFLGLTTTITHTAGVFFFGLLVLFASRFILPDQLFPYLGIASGLLVVFIGASLAQAQYRKWRGANTAGQHHGHSHDHDHGYHTHFGVGHSHLPSDLPSGEAPPSWRNLLALGISGGILPCPSALVVLLSAIALQRVAFGLLLIIIFSLGLASVLTGLGLIFVYAGRWFERGLSQKSGRLVRALPIVSATFITLAGFGITFRALLDVI